MKNLYPVSRHSDPSFALTACGATGSRTAAGGTGATRHNRPHRPRSRQRGGSSTRGSARRQQPGPRS